MEIDDIKQRYSKRDSSTVNELYTVKNAYYRRMQYEKTEAIVRLITKYIDKSFADMKILEVGCGFGSNLINFLSWGCQPYNLAGNDLMENRIETARKRLPQEVDLSCGDASELGKKKYDIVYASTVFTSILDDGLRKKLANHMWEQVDEDGMILCYDFTVCNPRNKEIKSVKIRELKRLFPSGDFSYERVHLFPPLGWRVLGRWNMKFIYHLLYILPFLRSHVVCVIKKQ